MKDIKEGDWLECVRVDSTPQHTLVIGALYRLKRFMTHVGAQVWNCPHCGLIDDDGVIELEGFECSPTIISDAEIHNWAYHICCFKPIDDGEKQSANNVVQIAA